MKRKIKVAAIQMEIEPLDVKANLKKAEKMLKNLFVKEKCDLVVFPEDFIAAPIPYNLEFVQNEKSDSIKFFEKLAKFYNTYIVCGSVIKKIGNKYFNTSFLINDKGEIILEYQKNNLWHPERRYITSGSEIKTAKTQIGNIGIIICWDLIFPEICQKLAKLGADIICCPSFWVENDGGNLPIKYGVNCERIHVNALCEARAIENEVLFIYANGGGIGKVKRKSSIWQNPMIGQSQICTPVFGRAARIDDNREGFITHEFDRQILKDVERVYKIRKDLLTRSDLVSRSDLASS